MREYTGEITHDTLDGYFSELSDYVSFAETVKFYRSVPRKIYDIDHALAMMSDEEQIKVMKYITRITNKRITFKLLAPKPRKKPDFSIFERAEKDDDDF